MGNRYRYRAETQGEERMTQQEIQELAGHREVPPWVVKLVADAVAKEREACAKLVDYWEAREGEHADAIRARGQA